MFISLNASHHLNVLCSNVFEQLICSLFGPPAWPHSWYEHVCVRVKLVIRILSSNFQVTHKLRGRSTIYLLPCLGFNPWTTPSLPIIVSTTHPSFRSALFFASLFNNITAPVSGLFGLSAVELDFLSPRAWTSSYTNLLRSCSLLLCKNIIGLDTFSSPIVSRSSSKTGFGFPLSRVFGVSTGCLNSFPW